MNEGLSTRMLTTSDYDELLVGWWSDWGWEAPPRGFLPHDATGGIMVMDGDTPVVAGFLYLTNSSVAWVDFIISNKQYRKKPQRSEAIKILIERLTDFAKHSGAEYSYALIKHHSLIATYEALGYIAGDKYNKEMIKVL